jgi:RHS repeat-associated protein
MKRVLRLLGSVILLPTWASAATFDWTAPATVPSGQTYTVGVVCWPTYANDPGLQATLYKNGSFFAYNTSPGGVNVTVSGSTSDTTPQTVEYSAELYVYDGLYSDETSSQSVTIVGSNHAPVASVVIDGYGSGATVTRPRAGSVNVTVRYKATDADGNLTGIRPYFRRPDSTFNNNGGAFIAKTGGSGEVDWTVTLDQNGAWDFKTHAQDSVIAPNYAFSAEYSLNVVEAVNDATLVSQSVPSAVYKAASFAVSQTWHNAGTNTWAPATNHHLGSQNPQDNNVWGAGRWNLPSTVSPGANVTVAATLTAPGTAGTYNYQTRMVQDGVEWFGASSTNVAINVANRPTATITADSTSLVFGQSTTVRANFSLDTAHGDSAVASNIDSPEGTGLPNVGGTLTARTYLFAPAGVGATTFYARLAPALAGSWATYGTVSVAAAKATPIWTTANPTWAGTHTVSAADLSNAFSNLRNPYSSAVAQPTGTVAYAVTSSSGTGASPPGPITAGSTSLLPGTYTVTATYSGNGNYNATTAATTWTINKVNQTLLAVSANPSTVAFGNTASLSTTGGSGAGAVSYAAGAGGAVSGNTFTATAASGTVTITATKAADTDYYATSATTSVTLARRSLTVTAPSGTKNYDGSGVTLGNPTLTSGSLRPGDSISFSGNTTSIPAAAGTTTIQVGTVTVRDSGGNDVTAGYSITRTNGSYHIDRVPLTITANNATRPYGAANPALTYGVTGLVNGDTASVVTGVSVATMATASSGVGGYAITASGGNAANYTLSYAPGTLTVTAAGLTITASNASKTYGAANPALTYTVSGLVNGDTAGVVSGVTETTTATASSPVGSYAIAVSGGTAANYTLNHVAGTLTVGAASLTITANPASKTYGAPNPGFTASYSGWVNGDTPAVVSGLNLTTTATPGSGVGTYPITGSGASAANYTIHYAAGTLTVNPAPLTITANNATRTYGAANPAFSASYSGLVAGDTPAVVSGLSLTTTASAGSNVGTYPITASGGSAANYTITHQNGTLTIDRAPLSVTAPSGAKTYDGTGATLGNPTVVGSLVPGDIISFSGNTTVIAPAVGTTTTVPGTVTIRKSADTDVTASYDITTLNGSYVISAWTPPAASAVGSLDVTPSVDNKGAATVTIPLPTPPGRAGMAPSLALVYNSNAGNGPLGLGWTLSTGFYHSISRGRSIRARDGFTHGVNYGPDDRLYLDGKRLIHTNALSGSDPYWQVGNEYRTEVDTFMKITAMGPGGDETTPNRGIEGFRAVGKDGVVYLFGKTDAGSADAIHSPRGSTAQAYEWKLKRVIDPVGNTIEFSYVSCTDGAAVRTGEHVLSEIRYTANADAGVAAAFVARFIYSPDAATAGAVAQRPDPFRGFLGGYGLEAIRQLIRIEVGAVDASSVEVMAQYETTYETSPITGLSRLHSVTRSARKTAESPWATDPAVVCSYGRPGSDGAVGSPLLTSTAVSAASAIAQGGPLGIENASGDFNGDGITDMFVNGQVYLGNGAGFDDGAPWISFSAPDKPAPWFVKAGDINGDGLTDIIWMASNDVVYAARSTGSGFTGISADGTSYVALSASAMAPAAFHPPQFYGNIQKLIASRVSIGDFDGDGLADILIHKGADGVSGSYAGLYVGLSNRTGFLAPERWGGGSGTDEFGHFFDGIGFRDLATPIDPLVVDLDGDGIDDYVWTEWSSYHETSGMSEHEGYEVTLYSARCKPRFASLSRLQQQTLHWQTNDFHNPHIASEDWIYHRLCGDVNGDGYPDLLILGKDRVQGDGYTEWILFESKGDGSFETHENCMPVNEYGLPTHNMVYDENLLWPGQGRCPDSQSGGMYLQDANGDGRADYIWYNPASGRWYIKYATADGFGSAQLFWSYAQGDLVNAFGSYDAHTVASDSLYGDSSGGVVLRPIDLDGDGALDWLLTYDVLGGAGPIVARAAYAQADRLSGMQDGVGSQTKIAYASTADRSIYTPGAAVSYPIQESRRPQLVVSDLYRDSGGPTPTHFLYQYSGRRTDLSGRGDLGFHSFVTLDAQTNVFKYQFLTQSFPMTGLSAREQTYRYWPSGSGGSTANFRLISSHDNTVVFDKVVNGAGGAAYGTLYPFVSKAVESRWEDAATAHFSYTASGSSSHPEDLFPAALPSGAHITITAESLFDNQTAVQTTLPAAVAAAGYNPSDTTSSRQNAVAGTTSFGTFSTLPGSITYGNLTQLKTDYGDGYTEKVVTTYKAGQTLNGVLTLTGLADTVTTTVTSPDFGTETAPVKTYGYQPGTPLVTSEAIDAPGTALDFTTTHTRDSLGRITATTVSGTHLLSLDASASPITTYQATAFDPKFDRPTTEKDAYGHTTTTVYDPVLGLPTSVTDANGAEVTTQYDALGRVVEVTDVLKGLTTTTTYAWETAQPAVAGPTGFTGVAAGSGITGVTALSLTPVYAVTTSTTAQPTLTTCYDRLGRAVRTVKDGFNGQQVDTDTAYNSLGQAIAVSNPYPADGTVYWTKTTYDALGRVATVTAPNGTVTTTAYHGRATTVSVDAPSLGGVDPAAQVNATLVDAKGRTVKVWNADNVPSFSDTLGTTTTAPSIAFDLDGFGRMRTTTLKGQTQTITATYDALGRQLTLDDPDKGAWSYVNSALGHVLQQTDARGTVTQTTYDALGRPLARTTQEPSSGPLETANWYYYDSTADTATHRVALGTKGWIGALQREEDSTSGAPGYAATHSATTTVHYYNGKGLPELDVTTIDGKWFYTHTIYDTASRVSQVRHYWRPAGHESPGDLAYVWQDFGYSYSYDSKSYLLSITDSLGRTWWDTPTYDYLDRVTSVTKGGVVTQRTYRPTDGVLTAIKTGPTAGSTAIQNLSFDYDGLGNLRSRTGSGGTETLAYDSLNRLTSSQQGAITYFDNGNIKKKPDVAGTQAPADFTYDPAHPHAVASAFGYTLGYDGNGNLNRRTKYAADGITVLESWNFRYAGFDKPRWMAKTIGSTTVGSEFLYNANRSRTVQLEFDQMSDGVPSRYVRKRVYGLSSTLEANYANTAASGAPIWALKKVRIYVPSPDGVIGSREFDPAAPIGSQEKAFIYHYDHLGSIESITPFVPAGSGLATDSTGKPGRFSEDAWGARRDPTDWSGAPTTTDDGGADSLTPRGFTGHEMLDDLGLVHAKGRIYDPLLGRFQSADIVVQRPNDLQSYNRYSYVRNNPLTSIDPSGFIETTMEDERRKAAANEARRAFIRTRGMFDYMASAYMDPGYRAEETVSRAADRAQTSGAPVKDRVTTAAVKAADGSKIATNEGGPHLGDIRWKGSKIKVSSVLGDDLEPAISAVVALAEAANALNDATALFAGSPAAIIKAVALDKAINAIQGPGADDLVALAGDNLRKILSQLPPYRAMTSLTYEMYFGKSNGISIFGHRFFQREIWGTSSNSGTFENVIVPGQFQTSRAAYEAAEKQIRMQIKSIERYSKLFRSIEYL